MRRLGRAWEIRELTPKNRLTYLRKRLLKYQRNKEQKMYELVYLLARHVFCDTSFCNYCIEDEFGYCGIRRSYKTDKEIFDNHCLQVIIKCVDERVG